MKEFFQYIVTPAGLGAMVTVLMFLIQKFKPEVTDDAAYLVSVLLAAGLGMGGYFLIPFVDKLPPVVGTVVWSVLVWAFNYLWFRFGPKRAARS